MSCMILFYPVKNLKWVLKRLKVYIYLFSLLEYKYNIWGIPIFLGDPGRLHLVLRQACHDSIWSCVSQTRFRKLKTTATYWQFHFNKKYFWGLSKYGPFSSFNRVYKLCLIQCSFATTDRLKKNSYTTDRENAK